MSEGFAKAAQPDAAKACTDQIKSAKTMTTAVYVLQALSFVFGITFIVAIIVNYIKKDEVQGTWLASHFRWQMRTFWFSVLWTMIGFLTSFILIGYFILLADAVWVIYRVIKGWLALSDGKELYQ